MPNFHSLSFEFLDLLCHWKTSRAVELAILSAINIGLTFCFQWYVMTQLGAGVSTDALFAGMTLPQLVLAVISGSLMHVLVPLLVGEENNQVRHDVWGFFILVGLLFAFFAIILYATAPWWVSAIVPGFSVAGQELTVKLTRIQLVGMVFSAVNGVQWAAYHARQEFIWAEFAPVISGVLTLMLLVYLLDDYGVVAAAWANVFRMALQSLLLAPVMGRPVWPDLRSRALRSAWQRIKPLLIGTAYYKTDPLVDRFLLSTTVSGYMSLYYLAQQIYGAASQVINKAIAAPLVPLLSMLHKNDDRTEFMQVYHRKLLQVGGLGCGAFLVILFFGEALLGLVVGYGSIGSADIRELSWIMVWLGGTFVGGVTGQISSTSFYAIGDTLTPTRIGIYSYSIYVPIKIGMFYVWGVKGIAMATSAFVIVNFLIQHYRLGKVLISNREC